MALVAALAAAGCAGPTPYQPLAAGQGFAEQQIEANRYRVMFSGNSATPRATVDAYLLYRAAELTVQSGHDYFVLAGSDTEPRTSYVESGDGLWAGPFGGGFGYGGWSGFYGGVGAGFGTLQGVTRYDAYADIQVFAGPKPAENPRAYDAREVLARVGPTVQRRAPS